MRFFLISDNIDTQMGMRLAGIEGVVAHTEEEVSSALDRAAAMPDVGIVLMTGKAVDACREKVFSFKLTRSLPLVVEIPDRHADSKISDNISQYLKDAVGITI
ncbi:MAG: V-type ATP synthase subunit F [Ruminococcus sp.]|nr:V-type ATP synthase subunit F [Ruminococcus sp.]